MNRGSLYGGLVGTLILVAASGCSSTSGSAPSAAMRGPSVAARHASPDVHQGQTVRLGGTIAAVRAHAEGMELEVIGRALDAEGRPERGEATIGRFIVRSAEPLDSSTYAPGRSITAVGQVAPMDSWWVDADSSYRYPVLTFAQLMLWPPDTTTGGVQIGQRYWVRPYTFWLGPPSYVPLVTTW